MSSNPLTPTQFTEQSHFYRKIAHSSLVTAPLAYGIIRVMLGIAPLTLGIKRDKRRIARDSAGITSLTAAMKGVSLAIQLVNPTPAYCFSASRLNHLRVLRVSA